MHNVDAISACTIKKLAYTMYSSHYALLPFPARATPPHTHQGVAPEMAPIWPPNDPYITPDDPQMTPIWPQMAPILPPDDPQITPIWPQNDP